jgi:hypothetical protein
MSKRFSILLSATTTVSLLAICHLAQAQAISACWPPGAAPGSKVEARLEGSNIGAASMVLIGGTGVKATMGAPNKDGNSVPVTLEVASDARPGYREIRLVTPKGMTTPGYVWIDSVPQVMEVEPNNQMPQATKLDKLPAAFCGRMDGGEDVDWVSFPVQAGDTIVMDIQAVRLFSGMDPTMELRDGKNRILAIAMEGYDRDPRIIHTFKESGTASLQIHDVMYRGGSNFIYRLIIGKLPVITGISPAGGRRGQKLSATVEGANLGGMKTVELALPADMPENQPFLITVPTPGGDSVPLAVTADDTDQITEQEGSNPAKPMMLANLPVTINARLSTPKEADTYQFNAKAGQPVQIELRAHGIGARLHAYVRVTDAAGKELMTSEDQVGRDPRMVFSPPADAAYRIVVTGLDNQGGPDYFYRLTLRPPTQPDFRVNASPDVVRIGKGETAKIDVNIGRRGYNGPVTIALDGVPAGVIATPLTIDAGQSTGSITLTAPGTIGLSSGTLKIVATGMIDGKTPTTRQVDIIASLPRPGDGTPMPRPVAFQVATTTDDVPLYTLEPEQLKIALAPGETATIKIKVARKAGDGNANPAIKLAFANLPPGVRAETPDIAEKAGEQVIKLIAEGNAPPGQSNAILTGNLNNNVKVAPAIHITVKPK